MTPYPRGSEWRKWDLHIHSPASALNNQFSGSSPKEKWNAYIAALKEIQDISVVGITDYFSIDGYKQVVAAGLTNFALIVPNVELRMLPVTKTETPINIHVIFNPDIVADLESKFFSGLEYEYGGETFKCIRTDLIKLGRKYKNNAALAEDIAYREGVDQFKIRSVDDIKALFKKDEVLRENALVAVSNSNVDGASGIQHSSLATTREQIYRFADFIFSSNPKDRQYFLAEGTDDEETVSRKYGALKACIHGSDAHDLYQIAKPCALRSTHDCEKNASDCEMRHCWVKADPTFEGLKQVSFEPNDRVQIQSTDPTSIKSNYCIETIEISDTLVDDELSFAHTVVPLNMNLVAVTGGKGSGKTALVDLVANCYFDRVNTEDTNSFVRRITAEESPDLRVRLTLKDGTVFKKSISNGKFYEDSPIVYIAQGDLESHVTNTEALEKHIGELVFESPKVKDTEKQFEYDRLLDEAGTVATRLQKKSAQVDALEQKTAKTVETALATELAQHKAKLKDLSTRIAGIEKTQSKAKTDEAKKKQEQLGELRSRKDQLLELQKAVQAALDFHSDNLPLFNDEIRKINSSILSLKLTDKPYPEIHYAKLSNLDDLAKLVAKEQKAVVAGIEKFQKDIQKTAEEIKLHTKLLDDKKTIAAAVSTTEKKIKLRGEDGVLLIEERKRRRDILKALLQSKMDLKKAYDLIIEAFSENADDILNDLTFAADLQFDEEKFYEGCAELFDARSVVVRPTSDEASNLAAVIDAVAKLVEKRDVSLIDRYVDAIESVLTALQPKLRKAATGKMLCDHLFSDFWSVVPSVKYKNVSLDKLSLGQKATVLIKIYLAQGDKPIIIDSHDDHLDNEFIMDELVVAVRKAKKYRQVIIVSNNGNMVVNSDAEQLIIASRDSAGSISYISGSLENVEVRDKALTVLEGGKGAFVKRQQKYRLQA